MKNTVLYAVCLLLFSTSCLPRLRVDKDGSFMTNQMVIDTGDMGYSSYRKMSENMDKKAAKKRGTAKKHQQAKDQKKKQKVWINAHKDNQTKEVRKRMKQNERKAKRIAKGKNPDPWARWRVFWYKHRR